MTERQSRLTEAVESVLLELMRVLGEYRSSIVLVGGMVPSILIDDPDEIHAGSSDLDLMLDHMRISDTAYSTIVERLTANGYRQSNVPFRFERTITIDGEEFIIPVDFLAGEYDGTGASRRHQRSQDLLMRKVRGGDLAVDSPVEVRIDGRVPSGALDSNTCFVVRPAMFVVLKALAMRDRQKAKDAYDMHYMLMYYPGGEQRLLDDFRALKNHTVVKEALAVLSDKFASPEHVGPLEAAEFRRLIGTEEGEMVKRDAYERVTALLRSLR